MKSFFIPSASFSRQKSDTNKPTNKQAKTHQLKNMQANTHQLINTKTVMSGNSLLSNRRKASQEILGDDISVPEIRPITSDDLKHEKPSTYRHALDTPKRIPPTHHHVHPSVRTMILNPVKMSSIELQGHQYNKTPSNTRLSLAVSLPMVAVASADNRYD